jgi:hypothetical protein
MAWTSASSVESLPSVSPFWTRDSQLSTKSKPDQARQTEATAARSSGYRTRNAREMIAGVPHQRYSFP